MFPKAQIKRFNDSVGCAPPPGAYDPKNAGRAHGGVVDKSERFKEPKVSEASGNTSSVNVSTGGSAKNTPVKQLFAAPQAVKSNRKTKTTCSSESTKIRELEQQIKSLLKEKTDKEKLVSLKEEELKKLDGRLHNVQTDKSTLQAKLAAAQRQLLDVNKANGLLKAKESSSEAASKKLEDLQAEVSILKQQITQKETEITRLKKEQDVIMATLLSSVQMLETLTCALEEVVQSCAKSQTDSTKACTEKAKKSKTADDFIAKLKEEKQTETKIKMIKKKIQELQQRFEAGLGEMKVVFTAGEAGYQQVTRDYQQLVNSVEQMKGELQLAIDVRQALEEQRETLQDSNTKLEGQMQLLSVEHNNVQEDHKTTSRRILELQESKAILEARFEDLQHTHATVERELNEKLKAFEDTGIVMSETTSQMHERLVELQAENEDFVATLKETGELLSKTKEENVKLEEMLQQIQENWAAEKKELLVKIENISVEKSKVEGELADTEKKVQCLNDDLEQQKTTTEGQVTELNAQLEMEKSQLLQLQNKLGDLVFEKSQLHSEIGHLEAQLKLVKCESEQMKMEAGKALDAVPALKERIEALHHAKAEAEERAEDLQDQNANLQKTLEIFQIDLDSYTLAVERDKHEVQRKIVSLTEEVEGLREQKDQMARELDDWLTDKSELDIEIAKLQCRIKVLEMDNNQHVEETEAVRKEERAVLEKVRAELEKARAEKKQQEEESEAVLREERVELEKVKAEKRQIEEESEAVLREERAELEKVKVEKRQQEVESEAVLREERAELEKVKAEKRQMETDMEQYGIDLLSNAAQIQSLHAQIHSITSECDEAKQCSQALREELAGVKVNQTDMEKSLTELQLSYTSKCEECAALMEENCQLGEALTARQEDVEDLECRLEQLRADFLKRCEERDGLYETNQVKDKSLAVLSQQVAQLNEQLGEQSKLLHTKSGECEEKEQERTLCQQQVLNYRQQLDDYREHLQLKCEECDDLKQRYDDLDTELTLSTKETVDLYEKIESLKRYNTFLYDKLVSVTTTGYKLKELRQGPLSEKANTEERLETLAAHEAEIAALKLQQAESSISPELEAELARYKTMLEELQAKVEPFMDQIDAFELEKQTLLGMNKNTQAEMEKLATNYAQLLGHQNQKQKIKHIVKIKEENNALKVENMSLKSQVTKQKRTIQKFEEKDVPKKVAKAFKTSRENLNVTAVKSPLKEVNRK